METNDVHLMAMICYRSAHLSSYRYMKIFLSFLIVHESIFSACYLWPWLGPPLMAMGYVYVHSVFVYMTSFSHKIQSETADFAPGAATKYNVVLDFGP